MHTSGTPASRAMEITQAKRSDIDHPTQTSTRRAVVARTVGGSGVAVKHRARSIDVVTAPALDEQDQIDKISSGLLHGEHVIAVPQT